MSATYGTYYTLDYSQGPIKHRSLTIALHGELFIGALFIFYLLFLYYLYYLFFYLLSIYYLFLYIDLAISGYIIRFQIQFSSLIELEISKEGLSN